MKNVVSLKANNTNSPKTPGGISKTLLTPCRRVGLSRNWKRSGPSPFISPLASSAEGNSDKPEERNRKDIQIDKKCESPASPNINQNNTLSDVIVDKTPTRNVALPRKRKSKTLLAAITSSETNTESNIKNLATQNDDALTKTFEIQNTPTENVEIPEEKVTTPVRVKSKSKSKKVLSQVQTSFDSNTNKNICDAKDNHTECKEDKKYSNNSKSPNELKKECIVVIQRKIFKKDDKKLLESIENSNSIVTQDNTTSQTLFDSDSDEMPLCQLNKTGSQKSTESTKVGESEKAVETVIVNEDDDFIEHKSKIRKLDTNKSLDKQKNEKKAKKKIEATKINVKDKSFDDDEDFDFDNKKTILIRKTYEKVNKPLKAKSTGSITQKDIDDLKARIEFKKKILLAKTAEDTKELRDLIKKWQKGCQDALMELMDLMKKKFPDKSNMDYSQILETLRIPASLVGYDSENDCFNTPDDESIILSHVNNT